MNGKSLVCQNTRCLIFPPETSLILYAELKYLCCPAWCSQCWEILENRVLWFTLRTVERNVSSFYFKMCVALCTELGTPPVPLDVLARTSSSEKGGRDKPFTRQKCPSRGQPQKPLSSSTPHHHTPGDWWPQGPSSSPPGNVSFCCFLA